MKIMKFYFVIRNGNKYKIITNWNTSIMVIDLYLGLQIINLK